MTQEKQRKAMHRLLTENYIKKTTIKEALRCSYSKAIEVFDAAKELDLKKTLIDPRPDSVQVQSVLKVVGLNYSFIKKQFDELSKPN